MKIYFFKVVVITAVFLCGINLSAQQPFKVGDEFDTNIHLTNTYQKFKSKSSNSEVKELVYEKEFFSKNSSYIKLYFENFDLAPGDYLEIIGSDSKESHIYGEQGKIVDTNNTMISNFWSRVMFDEKITIKLYSSGKVKKHFGFDITKVAYGYSEKKIMDKILSQQRSICSADNKESIACYQGTAMYEKAKAVCRLLIGGSSLCTGWLLGSEGHLMTNNHCIGSASAAQNTDFIFNYEYQNCSGSSNANSDIVASSANFIKTNYSLDYTLVKLPVNPTNTYGYLRLSTVIPTSGDRIYIPQHPGGRRKEISVNTDTDGTSGGFSRVYQSLSGSGQQVRYYADTEGGSSGSPVLDYNSNLVIAIHNTGGCPNGSYGRCDNLISAIGGDMPNNGVGSDDGGDNPPVGSCDVTISSFPYSQSFENTIGAWVQSTQDDFNWSLRSGTTPSSNTGPSSADTGSYYLYTESSSPNYSNKDAIITSPCYDLTSVDNADFSFKYHMFGRSTMGTLKLQARTDNATSWSTIWEESGSQGNSWQSVVVNLSNYAGTSLQLRFYGTTGTTWQGDMAIDGIALTTDGVGSGPGSEEVTLQITFDNYATETSWQITNASGIVVASGSNYGGQANGSSLSIAETLPLGCYTLQFNDSYGDGICCAYGSGSYTLRNSSNDILASGGAFGTVDSSNFCIGESELESTVSIFRPSNNAVNGLLLYPNPSINSLNITLPERDLNGEFRIINAAGALVKKGNLQNTISVEDIAQGLYFIEITTNKATYSSTFIKKSKK